MAGVQDGSRRCTRGTRPAVHVQLETSRSPCPDNGRPGGIVHDRDRRRDGDRPSARDHTAGLTIIQLVVDDWTLERLMTFDAETADLEDGGDGEPDDHAEEDGPPVVVEIVRPKVVTRRRALASGCVG